MRRAGQLFDQIVNRDNLRLAFWKAARGKRDRTETREFEAELEQHLQGLRSGLLAGTFPVGRFQQFVIHDPKERVITAPCFEERVLHHAMMTSLVAFTRGDVSSWCFRNSAIERLQGDGHKARTG